MVLKQENPHHSFTSNGGFKRTDTEPLDDHWAFLEDFEAPMWVDFELEAQSMNNDIDDDWFQSVHPVHQCSSRELKSRFSKGKGCSIDLICLSPKLPDSVSRSRGKHYKTRKWVGGMNIASQVKQLKARTELLQHPIKNLCRKTLASKSTNRVIHGSDSVHSNSMSTVTSNLSIKHKTSSGGPRNTSNLQEGRVAETNPQSSISTLSTMRISLAKSSTANSEPGVEIKNGRMFRDRKSSSSKCSIGSSSNPRRNSNSIASKSSVGSSISAYNGNSISRLRKGSALESMKVASFASSANFKGKVSNVSKQPIDQILDGNSNSKRGRRGSVAEINPQSSISTLSTMRISLAKSSIANSEPGVGIKKGRMFRDRKSSSSKCSIGSSSNPRRNSNSIASKSSVGSSISAYNGNSISRLGEGGALESMKVASFASSANFKGKVSNVSKQPIDQILDGNSNSKRGGGGIAANHFSQGSKPKLLNMASSRKSVLSLNVADPLLGKLAKSKQSVGSSKLKGVPVGGKENIVGGMVRNQKPAVCMSLKDGNVSSNLTGKVGGHIQNIPERKPRNATRAIFIR